MNDLPEDELLSAYLDDELSAAERAEVERRLAADPAARQLLDELRAVSAAIQALPRRKLGEDLTPEVLRVAERRMLTEGEPEPPTTSPSAAVPLGRAIFRRFVNRRTLFWLSLTAAVALIIKFNERPDHIAQPEKSDREVARAPVQRDLRDELEKAAKEPRPIPAMQAAPAKKELIAGGTAVVVDKNKKPGVRTQPAGAPAATSADNRQAAEFSVRNVVGERGNLATLERTRQEEGQLAGKPGPVNQRFRVYKYEKDKDAGGLVVHCDISPEAAQEKAFYKLLDANGISWHRQNDQRSLGFAAREQTPEIAKQTAAGDQASQQTAAAGEVTGEVVVYAEATPAQINAALAGLAAQPTVFLSFSIRPAQGSAVGEVAGEPLSRGEEQSSVVGSRDQRVLDEKAAGGQQKTADAAVPFLATQQPPRGAKSGEVQQQMGQQFRRQQLAQSAPRQPVVFVLRVVGDDQSAATSQSQVKPATGAAQEPKPSSPPTASPAKHD